MNRQWNDQSMSTQPLYNTPTYHTNMNIDPSAGYTEYYDPQSGVTWYNTDPYNNPPNTFVNTGYNPYYNNTPQMAGFYPPRHQPRFDQPNYMYGGQQTYMTTGGSGFGDGQNTGANDYRDNFQRPGNQGGRPRQYHGYGGYRQTESQSRRQQGSQQSSQSWRHHGNDRYAGYESGRKNDSHSKVTGNAEGIGNPSENTERKVDQNPTKARSAGRGSSRREYQDRKFPGNQDIDTSRNLQAQRFSSAEDKEHRSSERVEPKSDTLDAISSLLEKQNESKSKTSKGAGENTDRQFENIDHARAMKTVKEQSGRRFNNWSNNKAADGEKYNKNKNSKDLATPWSAKSYHSDGMQSRRRNFMMNRREQTTESQTGSMIESLSNGTYECMVCFDVIRCQVAVWSCQACYTVFHLHCVRKWARSPIATSAVESAEGWRCPACQNVCHKVPSVYRCFCGQVRDPEWHRMQTPHSCAEICRKRRTETSCPHTCNLLCHPGPCPTCPVTVTKSCACGRTKKSVRCGTVSEIHCDLTCGWKLNCEIHSCERICHAEECGQCQVLVNQECYCGRCNRDVLCGDASTICTSVEGTGFYACEQICGRELSCGNHPCQQQCHQGPCQPCQLLPSVATHCPCGQTSISTLLSDGKTRTSCTDPLPTCQQICNKRHSCGSQDDQHLCKSICHTGECDPCSGTSIVKCRCGYMDKEIPCIDIVITAPSQQPTCDKRCNKKRQCGRHRCIQRCCVDEEHKCPLVCNRKLNCGWHKCEEPCHGGNCEQCWQTGFDELTCYCGAEILFPPIPCGTRPPECSRACTRQHDCDHAIQHTCHSEEKCPPCTFLVERQCMGRHEMRRNIPCHIKDITCGKICGNTLTCQQHRCQKICHKEECDDVCNQPCVIARPECGHACSSPCHPGQPCPKHPCKKKISVTCKCGNRKEEGVCQQGGDYVQMAQSFQRLATSQLASKMCDIQSGQSVDIRYLTQVKEGQNPRQLECTEDCAIIERNRRVADALQIQNPDLSSKPGVAYCQFLKEQARKNAEFVSSVEKELGNLVTSVQQSKHKKRSHSFAPGNRDQRRVIHELAEMYGCETQSYDQEPKRNTVATAIKNKSEIPAVTLTNYTQRQLHPKAPPPIPHGGIAVQEVRQTVLTLSKSTESQDVNPKKESPVDYFDMVQ
ncbi:transcriptional repressor NF-X1-like isoform X2 [Glandiceps talaboti]